MTTPVKQWHKDCVPEILVADESYTCSFTPCSRDEIIRRVSEIIAAHDPAGVGMIATEIAQAALNDANARATLAESRLAQVETLLRESLELLGKDYWTRPPLPRCWLRTSG